jgi:hypothetical protein
LRLASAESDLWRDFGLLGLPLDGRFRLAFGVSVSIGQSTTGALS